MPADDQPAVPERGRVPFFRREPIDVGEVLVEILAVVLGVLIAMAIGRWQERLRDQRTVDAALHAIRIELQHNRHEVRAFAAKLKASSGQLREANQALLSNQPRASWKACMFYEDWGGFVPPMLLNTAYEVAVATQALAKMPYRQAGWIANAEPAFLTSLLLRRPNRTPHAAFAPSRCST